MDTNKKLIDKVKEFNSNVKTKYNNSLTISKGQLREKLALIGSFTKLNKTTPNKIKMACIDGSVNKVGGSFPHYIELYQGLGKISGGQDVLATNVYSPIIDGGQEDEDQRTKLLAAIEIEVALEIANNFDVDLILMDGGLIRYSIESKETFQALRQLCINKNIVLAGYIKEVKTNFLYELLFKDSTIEVYDKDLLYGVLNIGEMLTISENIERNKITKEDANIYSAYFRMANYPGITGIDLLKEQKSKMLDIGEMCYSISPEMGRGVPMIIDIVDAEVRLDDYITEEIIKSHIDTDIYQRFFVSERDLRTY